MKRLVFFMLLVFLGFYTHATHIYGQQISYRYIGDSTGVAHHYEIIFDAYVVCGTINTPPANDSIGIHVNSSCYATEIKYLNRFNLNPIPQSYYDQYYACVDSQSTQCLVSARYAGEIVLPGQCADYRFSYTNCCRAASISNLVNSSSQWSYIYAELNNIVANNSSVSFHSNPILATCTNIPVQWKLLYSDLDSFDFQLTSLLAQSGANSLYNAGYSASYPLVSSVTNPLAVNSQNGWIDFTATMVQSSLIGILINEYTYDSTYFQWIKIGSTLRELLLVVSGNCSPSASQFPYDYAHPSMSSDPVSGLPLLNQLCQDSSISIPFDTDIDCYSIAPDGSDFRLSTSSGQPLPIVGATAMCNVAGLTKQLHLKLATPIANNGTYYLYSKLGTDGNTILNECGFALPEFDTILLKVTDCSGIGLDEEYLKDKIVIPNYFSPNGDGVNDVFTVHIPESFKGRFELNVTNRHGRTVYREANYSNQGWDGNLGNSPLPDGVYFCTLTWYEPGKTAPVVFKNHVTIIR